MFRGWVMYRYYMRHNVCAARLVIGTWIEYFLFNYLYNSIDTY